VAYFGRWFIFPRHQSRSMQAGKIGPGLRSGTSPLITPVVACVADAAPKLTAVNFAGLAFFFSLAAWLAAATFPFP